MVTTNLEERCELLSRQNQQQNGRFEKLSKTIRDSQYDASTALENLTPDKHKCREGEHVTAQTCQKRARTLVEYLPGKAQNFS